MQAFIQAVLLMSVFEQRSSFQMFYFMTNNHEVIEKFRWVSGGTVSSAVHSWWSLGGVLEVKALKNFRLFTLGGQLNGLK